MREAVIVSATRTPIGAFNGSLRQLPAPELSGSVIKDALKRVNLRGDEVDEVIMGNVVAAGLGQAPARQASLLAGIPQTVGCTTINKVCGSGLKAVMLAAQAIRVGEAEIVVAGGMESMSNSPYLLRRSSFRKNVVYPEELIDSMIKDGLWDVYNDFHMGAAAELCAKKFGISREEQDAFAVLSYQRAIRAQENGCFNNEITPLPISEGSPSIDFDEELKKFDLQKLKNLKPAFQSTGTITAGNGAAAIVVMEKEKARSFNIDPLVRIIADASAAGKPEWFTVAPVEAILSLLHKTRCTLADVDLFEINEAFAASSIAVNRNLGIDRSGESQCPWWGCCTWSSHRGERRKDFDYTN